MKNLIADGEVASRQDRYDLFTVPAAGAGGGGGRTAALFPAGSGSESILSFEGGSRRAEDGPGGSDESPAAQTGDTAGETGAKNTLILIVDDDPASALMVSEILRQAGFQTATARDGVQGISLALMLHPDLVFLDVNLPDIDGMNVCRRIKADSGLADVPILFISANEDTAMKVRGFEAGGVDYITKPLVGAEIIARARTHLRLKRAYDTLEHLQKERLERLAASQQMIMPTPRQIPRARFAVSMKQFHGAGGDFYDVIPIGERLMDYIVADGSGHDLETSLWTTAMKALLHEHAGPLFDPVDILRALNRSLCRIMPEGFFFTVLYARLNRRTGRLVVANGGHPPAICVQKDQQPVVLRQTGDVIGAFHDASFEVTELKLNPGDRFFLYTDGLVEAGGDLDGGIARLARICGELRNLMLEEAVERAVAEELARVEPSDDIVMMGVEF